MMSAHKRDGELPAADGLTVLPTLARNDNLLEVDLESLKGRKGAAREEGEEEKDVPGHSRDEEDEQSQKGESDLVPFAVKWISLVAIMVMPWGVNWSNSTLGPLRNTLRNELGINNEQFGVISSADAIINSIWPLLGGIMLDWIGVEVVTPICTTAILVGSIISAIGIQIVNWRLLAAGFIVQGFGTALLDSCQQVFFHAFGRRGGLAFAFGLENAISSAIGLAAEAAAVPIKEDLGLNTVFWIPVAFCGFSVAVNLVYIWYARRVMPQQYRVSTGRQRAEAAGKRKVVSLDSLWLLPWCFWMLPMTQLLQSGAAGGFGVARADIIRLKGYSESTAGFLTAGSTVIQVLGAPILGFLVDRWGLRFHYVALAPLLWITSCSLLGFTDVHPMVALVFASLAGIINGAPLQMALHLLVADHRLIGTAFGVWRAFNNSGSVIMDVSFGRLVDTASNGSYDSVLKLTIGLKSWAFALGIGYILVDRFYLGGGLTMTRAKRDAIEADLSKEEKVTHPITRRTAYRKVTLAGMALLCAMVITAWTLFFLGLAD